MINDLIRKTMMDNRKTIVDISNATGYSCELIRQIVIEDYSPTPKEAYKIMEVMGVDLGDMLR